MTKKLWAPAEPLSLAEKQKQVSDQCKVVAHLAQNIADVYSDYTKMMAETKNDGWLNQVGSRTASVMEILGDMMNGMDIITEEDAWTDPVFRAAHRLWPRTDDT